MEPKSVAKGFSSERFKRLNKKVKASSTKKGGQQIQQKSYNSFCLRFRFLSRKNNGKLVYIGSFTPFCFDQTSAKGQLVDGFQGLRGLAAGDFQMRENDPHFVRQFHDLNGQRHDLLFVGEKKPQGVVFVCYDLLYSLKLTAITSS